MKTPPEGYHTITPYLTLREVEALVEFVKGVFGAKERSRGRGDAGGLHVELTLGDSMLMIGGGPTLEEPMTAMLHVYVEDVDAVYQRAIEARASVLMQPTVRSHGDRMAGVKDPFGMNGILLRLLRRSHRPSDERQSRVAEFQTPPPGFLHGPSLFLLFHRCSPTSPTG